MDMNWAHEQEKDNLSNLIKESLEKKWVHKFLVLEWFQKAEHVAKMSTITIRSSSTITVPPGCIVNLISHMIQPDTATTYTDLDTIYYDSNILFPKYLMEAFEAASSHLQNLTPISIYKINTALKETMAKS